MTTKSCFNCRFFKDFSYPATREDPGIDEWGCVHPEADALGEEVLFYFGESPTEEESGQWYAQDCRGYQFKDWEEEDRLQAQAETEYEDHLTSSDLAYDLAQERR